MVIPSPATGRWVITVFARTVTVGKPNEIGRPAQGYAVVATGAARSGPCFVATAVYGDPEHPDVAFLRRWRDARLAPGARGRAAMRALVALYRVAGPPAARVLGRRPALAALVRRRLAVPVVGALRRASERTS